jgi:serine/threonine-protein kinase RsbW
VAASSVRSLELDLPAVPASASSARHAVAAMLEGLGVDLDPVHLVISEAVTNVVLHAYRGRRPGRVRLAASTQDSVLTLSVADDGVGMSPRTDSPGLGLGLAIIAKLAVDVQVASERGTQVIVRLALSRDGSRPEA